MPAVTATSSGLVEAREQFLGLVADVRPELHRYCARLTGSIIEGEDIVQETLGNASYDPDVIAKTHRIGYAPLEPKYIQPVIDICAKYKAIAAGFDAKDLIAIYAP